jgi:hypothetical protein
VGKSGGKEGEEDWLFRMGVYFSFSSFHLNFLFGIKKINTQKLRDSSLGFRHKFFPPKGRTWVDQGEEDWLFQTKGCFALFRVFSSTLFVTKVSHSEAKRL